MYLYVREKNVVFGQKDYQIAFVRKQFKSISIRIEI
mgnify:CR=1 FL=1